MSTQLCLSLVSKTITVLLLLSLFTQAQNSDPHPNSASLQMIAVQVIDKKGQAVTDLQADNFLLSYAGAPLKVTSVQRSDAPACVGLLLDRSGSMRSKNEDAVAALMKFVKEGNPANQYFVATFNDSPYLDQDFTSDAESIQLAFDRHSPRGGTALYDAVMATADHLMEKQNCKRRVLLAISDGGDNSSRKSLPQAEQHLARIVGLSLYAIMLPDEPTHVRNAREKLQELVASVGGEAYFTGSGKLEKPLHEIALALRNEYFVTYESPATTSPNRGKPGVIIRAEQHKDLSTKVWLTDNGTIQSSGSK
jgi:VWFA-related protein